MLEHLLLDGAGYEVTDDAISRHSPAGDHDAGLPRRYELASVPCLPQCAIDLEGDEHLAHAAVVTDRVHAVAGALADEILTDGQAIGRLANVMKLDALLRGEVAELGIVLEERVQTADHVHASPDRAPDDLAPALGQIAAGRGDPQDERVRRRFVERCHDRSVPSDSQDLLAGFARAGGIQERDDIPRAVAQDAGRGLRVHGVGPSFGQDNESRHSSVVRG